MFASIFTAAISRIDIEIQIMFLKTCGGVGEQGSGRVGDSPISPFSHSRSTYSEILPELL
jgi:hypothetical protein